MMIRGFSFFQQRLGCLLAAALLFCSLGETRAIILFRTGDPAANTAAPTGDLANSGWQFEGTFGNFLGTPIAPHYFITAQHIGGAPNFVFHGSTYTLVRSFDDPSSDLRIWEVAETFPIYAPLYTGSSEVGGHIVVIGRGTQRGAARVVDGEVRGWEWGASDGVQRWGENQVASIMPRESTGEALYALFDQVGLPNEAHLSSGDSGGGVFLNDGGTWKLAGINYDVDSFSSGPDGGGPYNAAMFDERGSYTSSGMLVTGNAPVPSGFGATRISAHIAWITSVISPRLANISARVSVGSGDAVSISGFIIAGANGLTKRVLLRGLGPSLQVDGAPVDGRLVDPLIELHDGAGQLIATNDDWREMQAADIQNTGLAPTMDRESALVASLPAGTYTMILRAGSGSGGIGLIEVYDLDTEINDLRMANLSARAFVGTGDAVLIGGIIVHSTSQRLLLRALGPELNARGVNDSLGDPALELHNADGTLIASNDNWNDAPNRSAISATGLAPTDAREAAILIDSSFGPSTAIVRGAASTTGIALLEAYLLK